MSHGNNRRRNVLTRQEYRCKRRFMHAFFLIQQSISIRLWITFGSWKTKCYVACWRLRSSVTGRTKVRSSRSFLAARPKLTKKSIRSSAVSDYLPLVRCRRLCVCPILWMTSVWRPVSETCRLAGLPKTAIRRRRGCLPTDTKWWKNWVVATLVSPSSVRILRATMNSELACVYPLVCVCVCLFCVHLFVCVFDLCVCLHLLMIKLLHQPYICMLQVLFFYGSVTATVIFM